MATWGHSSAACGNNLPSLRPHIIRAGPRNRILQRSLEVEGGCWCPHLVSAMPFSTVDLISTDHGRPLRSDKKVFGFQKFATLQVEKGQIFSKQITRKLRLVAQDPRRRKKPSTYAHRVQLRHHVGQGCPDAFLGMEAAIVERDFHSSAQHWKSNPSMKIYDNDKGLDDAGPTQDQSHQGFTLQGSDLGMATEQRQTSAFLSPSDTSSRHRRRSETCGGIGRR